MLELRNVTLRLKTGTTSVKRFSLDVNAGEIVTLMGRSGSGKSSLLSFIGGDLTDAMQAEGEIVLDGVALNALPAERRGIARLFQDDLLFPHMSVGENLLFAVRSGSRQDRLAMMRAALQRAGLEGFENRAPHTLSGGQRARVALMRALLAKPKAVLLDEPFSRLDAELRQQVRDYTFSHVAARGIPALMVSHDRADAPQGGRVLKIGDGGEVAHV